MAPHEARPPQQQSATAAGRVGDRPERRTGRIAAIGASGPRRSNSAGHAAGGARAAGAGTARGAAAAGLAEVDHAAARSRVQRTGLWGFQLFRFRREAEARRPGERERHRRPIHHRAQGLRRSRNGRLSSPRICCRRCATCSKIIAWKSKTGARWRIWRHGSSAEQPNFDPSAYGFQEFTEFLNYAQDKTVVRLEPHEEHGMLVSLGAEFYPPAEPPQPEPEAASRKRSKKTSRSLTWKASRPSSSRILRRPSRNGHRRGSALPKPTGGGTHATAAPRRSRRDHEHRANFPAITFPRRAGRIRRRCARAISSTSAARGPSTR